MIRRPSHRTRKTMTKYLSAALAALVVAACTSAPEKPLAYGNPPSLLELTAQQQIDIYKNIEGTYAVRVAKRGAKVRPLPIAAKQISPKVEWNGKTYDSI